MKFAVFLTVCIICEIFGEDLQKEEFKCQEGVSYIENDCNGCFCAGENLACTEKLCLQNADNNNNKCEVGTASNKDCNKCWCTKSYGTVCTKNQC